MKHQPLSTLVTPILIAKKQPPSSPLTKRELKGVVPFSKEKLKETDTSALEKQIDERAYRAYQRTSRHHGKNV